jgi:hypothetical protein
MGVNGLRDSCLILLNVVVMWHIEATENTISGCVVSGNEQVRRGSFLSKKAVLNEQRNVVIYLVRLSIWGIIVCCVWHREAFEDYITRRRICHLRAGLGGRNRV